MQKLYPTEHDSHLRDEHFAEWFEKRLWDSESWRKKSKIAKSNRDKGNDKAARHTGGSIGYDEYRARMAGELNLNSVDGMFFCNDRSKEAYASYLEEMIKKNGLEFSVDDPDIHDLEVHIEAERRSRLKLEEDIRKEHQERLQMQLQMKEFMKFMQRPDS
ncbi:hypothetical protein E3N88_19597 [Mikania micrantha]|uniref:Uncharacterized protein n=1 Tax=Mikania micrantha TaxID=192012 RepID=A0A5N6NNW1_9ASTR|nr:hypothetical protein E3N88_19597 [Mikania micrantha]